MWRAPTVRALALELSFLFLGESCSQEDRLQASQDCFSRGELQNPSVHCACFSLLFTLHLRPLAHPHPPTRRLDFCVANLESQQLLSAEGAFHP